MVPPLAGRKGAGRLCWRQRSGAPCLLRCFPPLAARLCEGVSPLAAPRAARLPRPLHV